MTIEEKIDYICEYVSFNKYELLARKHFMKEEIEKLYVDLIKFKSIL